MHRFSFISLLLLLVVFQGHKHLVADGAGSQVKYLPGFDGPLPFELETGYVGVDQGENVQLFYYFVKSRSDPRRDPLILWLVGGPGCSALSALQHEIGPIYIDEADDGGMPKLTLNPYSWTEVANLLFVDLPVGTGFSYAQTPEAAHSTGLQYCEQTYQFLQKWLADHPEYKSSPFYVGGHSYVGVTVPVIVQLISNGNEEGIKPWINIKGYLLGNPLTVPNEDDYKIPYAHRMGLISDELYESWKHNCGGKYINIDSSNLPFLNDVQNSLYLQCLQDIRTFHQLVDDLFHEQILEPKCKSVTPIGKYFGENGTLGDERKELHSSDEQHSELNCYFYRHKFSSRWANDPSVREALHVRKESIGLWMLCNLGLPYTEVRWDSTPYHANLSSKGYRSLIYSGDHDMLVPFISTQAWIRSLNYPIIDEWRQWLVEEQIAGYTRTYANNMTFATIKGGAHVPPISHPKECAALFRRWISYQSL